MRGALRTALVLLLAGVAPAHARIYTVVIEAMRYAPSTLTVKRGDTVVWVNRDPFPHTATAGDRSFDSHEIGAGRRWRHVVRAPGRHAYACSYHPAMQATLTVE